MTEQEAIKKLKTDCCYECSYGANSPVDCKYGACDVATATRIAIDALEEVQKYRAIGTVKEIKIREAQAKRLSEGYLTNLGILREYQSIGTPDECMTAVEKQKAKKPIRNDKCTCPSCGAHNEVFKKRRNTVAHDIIYCWHCGQAVEIDRLE